MLVFLSAMYTLRRCTVLNETRTYSDDTPVQRDERQLIPSYPVHHLSLRILIITSELNSAHKSLRRFIRLEHHDELLNSKVRQQGSKTPG